MQTKLTGDQLHDPILPYVRPERIRLHPEQSIGDALATIRRHGGTRDVVYFYVTDVEDRLIGVVPARGLLMSEPDAGISSIMIRDVIAIPDSTTVLVAAEFFVSQKLLAFPVVDRRGRLVGIVDVGLFTDEVVGLAKRSFDDIFQIIGVHATEIRTPWSGFKDRFPWLLCNIGGGILAAFLAGRYELLLDRVIVLALFIPVVLALAESVSIQSVTLTLQGLQAGGLGWRLLGRALSKEFLTAALLGAGCGAIVTGAAWVWRGQSAIALAIGCAIWLSMITACILGLVLPTALHAARGDPKIAAGPIVLAAADVATLLLYFNLADWVARS